MADPWWIAVQSDEKPEIVIDQHYAIDCPHCGTSSNLTAISVPRYAQMKRYKPPKVIVGYRCDACNAAIALRFKVLDDYHNNRVQLSTDYEELERPMVTFDYQHLPEPVQSDFREALTCYSQQCLNATAAMMRRTIQSTSTNLGAKGSDKVIKQAEEIKDAADIDEETFAIIKQVILDGHDGSHPHLPAMNTRRAAVLVELMKDVMYQIYVRKAKLQEAMKLRQEAIDAKKAAT